MLRQFTCSLRNAATYIWYRGWRQHYDTPVCKINFICKCPDFCKNEVYHYTDTTNVDNIVIGEPTLFRIFIGHGHRMSNFINLSLDKDHFKNRIFITHSLFFTDGANDCLLQEAKKQGAVIKDLAEFEGCGPQTLFKFITGKEFKYSRISELHLLFVLTKVLIESLTDKKVQYVNETIKGMITLFVENSVVADLNCRFIKPLNCEFDNIQDRLRNVMVGDRTTLQEDQISLFVNLSKHPTYELLSDEVLRDISTRLEKSPIIMLCDLTEKIYPSVARNKSMLPFLPMINEAVCKRHMMQSLEQYINKYGQFSANFRKAAFYCPYMVEPQEHWYKTINFVENNPEHEVYIKALAEMPEKIKKWYYLRN